MNNKLPENVKFNPNEKMVEKMQEVMQKNGGYCPCRLQRTPENICICAEFRQQIADPDFEGYCHCQLYYKEK
jgi:ferredoxin-thioredoxin reductase catalytic subunit